MGDILLKDFDNMSFLEMFLKAVILELLFLTLLFKSHLRKLDLDFQYGMQEMFFDSIKYLVGVFIFFIMIPALVIELLSYVINFFSTELYWDFYYFLKKNAKLYFNFSTIVLTAILFNFRDKVLGKITYQERFSDRYNSVLIDKNLDEKFEIYCLKNGISKSRVIEEKIKEFLKEQNC